MLIVPAMGCGQDYYRPFASWLATQGFTVATFDYRGTGLSRPQALRGFKADIFDWARLEDPSGKLYAHATSTCIVL